MKLVLVTGGNRGIGLEICRQLDTLGHKVILGSRDITKGNAAISGLAKKIIVKQLDVSDEESIQQLFIDLKQNFGKLDVLINNAGIGAIDMLQKRSVLGKMKNFIESKSNFGRKIIQKAIPVLRKVGIDTPKTGAQDVSIEDVKNIMETNFYGPWRMIQAFIPLLIKAGESRIINISSGLGEMSNLTGQYPGYSISKSSLNALTIMFSNELKEKGIKVNAMCPGWVKTDMGGPNATREVSEGADTAIWLATEDKIPTGKFFRDRKEINW